jgi:CDP-diacylglycerol--serine O-phosphatidyltransferase
MVTFGVVPGVVMFHLIKNNTIYFMNGCFHSHTNIQNAPQTNYLHYLGYVAFIITIFSAIRLAKFNNDTRQTDSFIGVPTPAVAIFVCSLPLILNSNPNFYYINPYILALTSAILSVLLISELPLFALKFKHFKWKGNEIRFSFLLISVLLLVILQFVGIPLVIILYILMSLVSNTFFKPKSSV